MADVDILIVNGTLMSMNARNQIIQEGAVAIKDGIITAVGTTNDLTDQFDAKRVLDATNHVIMPGLIDTYAHAGHSMIKGFWKPHIGWPASEIYFHASTPEFWYADGLMSAVNRLKFGVTTGNSIMGATPSRMDDPIYAYKNAQAVEEVGIRSVIGVGPPDSFLPGQNPLESTIWENDKYRKHTFTYEDTIENSIKFIKKWDRQADGRIRACLAYPYLFGRLPSHSRPRSTYKYQDEDIPILLERAQEIRKLADQYGVLIHTHVFGGALEYGLQKFGKEKVYELLGPDVVFAHANSLTNKEIAVMRDTDTKVATAPSADEAFVFGRCRIPELIENGVCVATSTDGSAPYMSYDIFISVRTEIRIQWYHFKDPSYMPAGKMLRMITIDAARVLGLDNEIGSIEKGKRADIILLNLFQTHLTPATVLPQMLVYYGTGHDVQTVLVDGQILMENRKILTVDETEVIEMAQEEITNAFDRYQKLGHNLKKYTELTDDFWNGFKQYEYPFRE